MSKPIPKFFWDSSIFLLVLNGEKSHGEDVLQAAAAIWRAVEAEEAIIVASQIVVVEVLASRYEDNPSVYEKWEAALQWKNLHLRAVDHPIAIRASKMRSDCLKKSPPAKPKLADLLHIATYLVYAGEVDELHSVDGDFKKALINSGNGDVTVTVPRIAQPALPNLEIESAGDPDTMDDDMFEEFGDSE